MSHVFEDRAIASTRTVLAAWVGAHPEWLVFLAIVAAWCAVFSSALPLLGSLRLDHGLSEIYRSVCGSGQWATGLGRANAVQGGMIMIVAMMLPRMIPEIRWAAFSSLKHNQVLATLVVSLGYLAAWTLYVIAFNALLTIGGNYYRADSRQAQAVYFLIAAAWQFTSWKRICRTKCHQSLPLPPNGFQAFRAWLTYGALQGAWCVGSCWALMLPMLSPGHAIGLTVLLFLAVIAERLWVDSLRIPKLIGGALLTVSMIEWTSPVHPR